MTPTSIPNSVYKYTVFKYDLIIILLNFYHDQSMLTASLALFSVDVSLIKTQYSHRIYKTQTKRNIKKTERISKRVSIKIKTDNKSKKIQNLKSEIKI